MDKRCPRKLKEHPTKFCPMAVMRLKAVRSSDEELTEEQEDKLPGCPWAVNHQMSNYCFFKFSAEYIDKPLSDMEIAHLNSISKEIVKKTEKKGLVKIRDLKEIKDIKEVCGDETIIDDSRSNDDPYDVL